MELKDYSTIKRWMGRLAPSTAKKNLQMFRPWMKWVRVNGAKFAEMDPDQFVEFQKGADSGANYEILDTIVQPYIAQKSGTHSYLIRIERTIRSFFLHNRAELPKDPSFRVRPDREKTRGTLNVEEITNLCLSSNEMYRAVFLCMFQGGMDKASFEYWNLNGYPDLRKQFMGDDPAYVRVDLPGRKSGKNVVPFYTFIGRDGIHALRTYLPDPMPQNREAIFINRFGEPVKKDTVYLYWLRHLRQLGYAARQGDTGHRTGKNPHEMRDVFRSRWRISGIDVEVAEFFMGHDIDKLGYDKSPEHYPEWFEDQYNQAQPWLNILTEDPQKVSRREVDTQRTKIQELETQIERLEAGQGGKIDELTRALQKKDLIMAEVLKRLEYLEKRG